MYNMGGHVNSQLLFNNPLYKFIDWPLTVIFKKMDYMGIHWLQRMHAGCEFSYDDRPRD